MTGINLLPPSRTNQGLRLPAYRVSQKNNDIGQACCFSPPHPLFPFFALTPTLRVTICALPNLPLSKQRWRLQQYEHKQAAFARPKYACTAGYVARFAIRIRTCSQPDLLRERFDVGGIDQPISATTCGTSMIDILIINLNED